MTRPTKQATITGEATDQDRLPPVHRLIKAGRLCELHAGPLLTLAILLLGDGVEAERVVIDTLVAACDGRKPQLGEEIVRSEMAADVYDRCAAVRGMRDGSQRGGPLPTRSGSPLMALSDDERALVGLVLFGAHDCGRAVTTLDESSADLVSRLANVVRTLRAAATSVVPA
jgi:hypothetical protein